MSDKTDHQADKLLQRVDDALAAGRGMEFDHAELALWHRFLLESHCKVEATLDMARTIGQSLRAAGLQIHVTADGAIDGIMPLARGGAQETVN